MTKQIISKIDAACRQLDCAISLYFQDGDIVSMHTLACAAHQIIHDINKKQKGTELLFNCRLFKNEKIGEVIRCFHKQYNFAKHANTDPQPENAIEFNPKITEIFIATAIRGVDAMGIRLSAKQYTFIHYFQLHNPETLSKEGAQFLIDNFPIDKLDNLRAIDKREFFEVFQKFSG